jgi:hypothetical protein
MGKEKPFLIRAIREIRGQSLPFPFEQRTAGKKTTDHTDDTDGGELGALFIRAIRVIRGQTFRFRSNSQQPEKQPRITRMTRMGENWNPFLSAQSAKSVVNPLRFRLNSQQPEE